MSFDLEKSIAAWRRPYEVNASFSAEDIEELENSLRDRIDALVKKNTSEKEAFRKALKRVGSLNATEAEYTKVYWNKVKRERRLGDELNWRLSMFKNFIKITLRNARRHPGYLFINVVGLAVGMACCLLISLYVQQELSYDKHHPDQERVYRVAFDIETATGNRVFSNGPAPLAPAIQENYPQVEEAVRLWKRSDMLVQRDPQRQYYEDNFFFADPSVLNVFSLPFAQGSPETALAKPESVVISARMAAKYFKGENPVGLRLTINATDYAVTGVLQEIRHNSHITFDFISSFLPIEQRNPWMQNWHATMFHTYLKLKKGANVARFEDEFAGIAERYVPEDLKRFQSKYTFFLQPISRIHLHSNLVAEIGVPGSILYLYIFSVVATLILLIASLNYINLTTAQSAKRAKEVGVRKAVGSGRRQLMWQFLSESVILSVVALVVALVLVFLVFPWFNNLTGYRMGLIQLLQPGVLGGMILLLILTGGLAGFFPAFILSSIHPLLILKGQFQSSRGGVLLRKVLVTSQFTITLVLIVGTITAFNQLDFMKQANLGFDAEQMLVLPTRRLPVADNFEQIKAEWLRDASIHSATASSSIPGRGVDNFAVNLLDEDDRKPQSMYHLFVDYDFISTYNIEMVAGRAFQAGIMSDSESAFLINEAGLSTFGWQTPEKALGKQVQSGLGERQGEIIGVYRDFNYQFLHDNVQPLLLTVIPDRFSYLSLKLGTDNLSTTLTQVEKTWQQLFPDAPFEYFFLDEAFNQQYQADEKTATLMLFFVTLAILIACLGLLGLAAFSAQTYRKEIGVRKVLGASVSSIVVLLTKNFTRLVFVAIIIGTPLAWFIVNRWLEDFAYRVDMSLWTFVISGLIALGIALLTVSYQSIKAAMANPVKSLRYE